MRYSIEPRIEDMEKAMAFYLLQKLAKNISKYNKKLVDSTKKSATDAIKTTSKRSIQKTAEATGDLIGNKIADKLSSVSTELQSKKSPKEFIHQNCYQMKYQKKDIYLHKKDNKLLMN